MRGSQRKLTERDLQLVAELFMHLLEDRVKQAAWRTLVIAKLLERYDGICGRLAFLIVGLIQVRIDAGETPHILWQIIAFVVLTAAEVMVSVTHLEFAYTQAPKKLKSLVMCTYLGAVALGNVFTAAVNFLIQNKDGTVKLKGASYFFFFVIVMLVTSLLFLFFARFYQGKTYIQDEAAIEPKS